MREQNRPGARDMAWCPELALFDSLTAGTWATFSGEPCSRNGAERALSARLHRVGGVPGRMPTGCGRQRRRCRRRHGFEAEFFCLIDPTTGRPIIAATVTRDLHAETGKGTAIFVTQGARRFYRTHRLRRDGRIEIIEARPGGLGTEFMSVTIRSISAGRGRVEGSRGPLLRQFCT